MATTLASNLSRMPVILALGGQRVDADGAEPLWIRGLPRAENTAGLVDSAARHGPN
jgi:hypothetical protein